MSNIEIRELEKEEFGELWLPLAKKIFNEDAHMYNLREFLSEQETENMNQLSSHMGSPIRINLGLFDGDKFIGWTWGFQESAYQFYMCNSAIIPEYRRQGLYTKLLNTMVDKVMKLGFQEIYGRHTQTNNAVIIPKLKAGFVISSFELSDMFGSLVILKYYSNKTRRKILDYRAGQIKPDSEINKVFNL